MDIVNAFVLGIIEGLTEFLPISSTGHMILARPLLGIEQGGTQWDVLLWVSQLGAIGAVVVYFWKDLWNRVFHPPQADWRQHVLVKLAAAMLPTTALALALKAHLDQLEHDPVAVAAALILGALLMELIDRRFRRPAPMRLDDVSLRQAFLIGTIQSLSMIPGVSRAGATIMGGMALGLTPAVATEFSFYLAIPTMLGAGAKTLWKHRSDLTPDVAAVVLVGTVTAFVVALLVVAGFMSYVKRYRFTPFAIYRVLLGTAVLIWCGVS